VPVRENKKPVVVESCCRIGGGRCAGPEVKAVTLHAIRPPVKPIGAADELDGVLLSRMEKEIPQPREFAGGGLDLGPMVPCSPVDDHTIHDTDVDTGSKRDAYSFFSSLATPNGTGRRRLFLLYQITD
jgi:hypothetical protein